MILNVSLGLVYVESLDYTSFALLNKKSKVQQLAEKTTMKGQ